MRSKSGMSEGPEKRRVGVRAEGGREGGKLFLIPGSNARGGGGGGGGGGG